MRRHCTLFPQNCILRTASAGLLTLLTTGLTAAENPAIGGLKREVEALRAQERRTIEEIHAHYDRLIRRDRFSEKELEQARHAVHMQEEALLAHAQTEVERQQIRARYDEMRHYLSRDVRLDERQIARLKEMRHEHVEHAKRVFHSRIEHVEHQIHELQHQHQHHPRPAPVKKK